MKLGEKWSIEGDKMVQQRTFDVLPTLERAEALRAAGAHQFGESRMVATIPGWLVHEWLKEAGVAWHDTKARDDVIRKKMLSGEYGKLRVWNGSY